MKLKLAKLVLSIIAILSIFTLVGCLGGGQKYNVTLIVKENGVPLSGVYASFSGSGIRAGEVGPSGNDGKLTVLNCVGMVQIAFSKDDYSFDPPVLTVNEGGSYEIAATHTQEPNQVPKPIITVNKETAENREEGITFELVLENDVKYYYSLDGSEPGSTTELYQNPVALIPPDSDDEATVVIKVIGQREGWLDSEIAEQTVTYQAKVEPNQVPKPIITVNKETAENREEGITFELVLENDVKYYYSLDGSEPGSTTELYQNPIVLIPPDTDEEATVVIKVIGQREGWLDSEIAEQTVVYEAKSTRTLQGSIHSRELNRQKVIVPVEISLKQNGQTVRKKTFAHGEYEFADLPEGVYQLIAVSEWCEEYSADVTVEGNRDVITHNFCLVWKEEALGSLSGRFYWEGTDVLTCETDDSEDRITLYAPGHFPSYKYERAENSFYFVDGIEPGIYQVKGSKQHYSGHDVEFEITIQPAENLVQDIHIKPRQSNLVVKTYKFRDKIASVESAILEIAGENYEIRGGSVTVEDIRPGKYGYTVSSADYWPYQGEIEIPINVSVDEKVYLRPSLGPVEITATMDDMRNPQYDAVLEYEMKGGNWEIGLSTRHLDRWTTDKYYGHVKRGDTISISATVTQDFNRNAIPATMDFQPTTITVVLTNYETTWYKENDLKLAYDQLEYKTSGTYELSLSYVVPLDYEYDKISMICEVVARTPDFVPYPVRSIKYDAAMIYDVID